MDNNFRKKNFNIVLIVSGIFSLFFTIYFFVFEQSSKQLAFDVRQYWAKLNNSGYTFYTQGKKLQIQAQNNILKNPGVAIEQLEKSVEFFSKAHQFGVPGSAINLALTYRAINDPENCKLWMIRSVDADNPNAEIALCN